MRQVGWLEHSDEPSTFQVTSTQIVPPFCGPSISTHAAQWTYCATDVPGRKTDRQTRTATTHNLLSMESLLSVKRVSSKSCRTRALWSQEGENGRGYAGP